MELVTTSHLMLEQVKPYHQVLRAALEIFPVTIKVKVSKREAWLLVTPSSDAGRRLIRSLNIARSSDVHLRNDKITV